MQNICSKCGYHKKTSSSYCSTCYQIKTYGKPHDDSIATATDSFVNLCDGRQLQVYQRSNGSRFYRNGGKEVTVRRNQKLIPRSQIESSSSSESDSTSPKRVSAGCKEDPGSIESEYVVIDTKATEREFLNECLAKKMEQTIAKITSFGLCTPRPPQWATTAIKKQTTPPQPHALHRPSTSGTEGKEKGKKEADRRQTTFSQSHPPPQPLLTSDRERKRASSGTTYSPGKDLLPSPSPIHTLMPPAAVQESKARLYLLDIQSLDWSRVSDTFFETIPHATIRGIYKIENEWMEEKYKFTKRRISSKNKGTVNEMELFHGSSGTPPSKIIQSEFGFDFRRCSQGMWGIGAYFAVNASYSNSYAYKPPGERYREILVARVLTGFSYPCKPDATLRSPPLRSVKSEEEERHYDTVCGHVAGSDVYVVYDHEKAYPTYLIQYSTT